MFTYGARRALLGSTRLSGPSLSLDFTSGTLDPRVTFSRPSLATMYDSTGKLTYAPNNLLTYSEDFSSAAWTKQTLSTVTSDATTAPDGATTADKLFETASTNVFGVYRSAATGNNRIFSIYAKAGERSHAQIYDPSAGSLGRFVVDLMTGLVTQNTGSLVHSVAAAAQGFYRIAVVLPSSTAFVGIAISGASTASSNFGDSHAGTAGNGIFIWGAQLEAVTYQTTPRPYVATTSAAYYGPRFDYDPVTLAAKGLLIEEARTNILQQSEAFSSPWTLAQVTIPDSAVTTPSGASTSKTWTSGTAAYVSLFQTVSVAASSAYTLTLYAKAGNHNTVSLETRFSAGDDFLADASYNLSTGVATAFASGASASMTAVGNGWYRLTLTRTNPSTGTSCTVIIGGGSSSSGDVPSSGLTFYFWGAQLEAGSFATSYIPTSASSVTRAADSASMTGTNFSSWYNQDAGTFVVEFDRTSQSSHVVNVSDGTVNERLLIFNNPLAVYNVDNGVNNVNMSFGSVTVGAATKAAFAYATNDFAGSLNGGAVATDTSGSLPTVNRLALGTSESGGAPINGHIASLTYYKTRRSNADLQALTAPNVTPNYFAWSTDNLDWGSDTLQWGNS